MCTKDLIEEKLFRKRRDLFSGLDLFFFDTTSIVADRGMISKEMLCFLENQNPPIPYIIGD